MRYWKMVSGALQQNPGPTCLLTIATAGPEKGSLAKGTPRAGAREAGGGVRGRCSPALPAARPGLPRPPSLEAHTHPITRETLPEPAAGRESGMVDPPPGASLTFCPGRKTSALPT